MLFSMFAIFSDLSGIFCLKLENEQRDQRQIHAQTFVTSGTLRILIFRSRGNEAVNPSKPEENAISTLTSHSVIVL